MDTTRPEPLDLATRDRATRRLNKLTTGVALAATLTVAVFGAVAAATDGGSTATTTTSVSTGVDLSTSGAITPSPTLGRGVAPRAASGPAEATRGGS